MRKSLASMKDNLNLQDLIQLYKVNPVVKTFIIVLFVGLAFLISGQDWFTGFVAVAGVFLGWYAYNDVLDDEPPV